jgi:putative ABC transport system substrate-binding protein
MRRRELLTLLGASAAWPLAAHAQQNDRAKCIGAIIAYAQEAGHAAAEAFKKGLSQNGWIEGKNINIEYRYAEGEPELYKRYAVELVGLSPDVILAGAAPAALEIQKLTKTTPVVFVLTADPIGLGLVSSLSRPAGNITGFSVYDAQLMAKWLGLLNQIAPHVRHVAVVFNPGSAPFANLFNSAIENAARAIGIAVTLAPVHDDAEIESAISVQADQPGGGILVLPESFSITHRTTIINAAARYGLPAVGMSDLFPRAGGLMSYWIDTIGEYSRAATYVDAILKGARPSDLPVQEPTRFSLILNLKTAKTLGLTVPAEVLAIADEVIE